MNFNLLALATFTLYNFDKSEPKKQTAVAWISTSITMIAIVIVLAYHVELQIMRHIKSKKRSQDDNTAITLFTSVNQIILDTSSKEDIVTHSSVELPSHDKVLAGCIASDSPDMTSPYQLEVRF